MYSDNNMVKSVDSRIWIVKRNNKVNKFYLRENVLSLLFRAVDHHLTVHRSKRFIKHLPLNNVSIIVQVLAGRVTAGQVVGFPITNTKKHIKATIRMTKNPKLGSDAVVCVHCFWH